jgi:hypothetical protein
LAGAAHAVVRGDGDLIWSQVVADCFAARPQPVYDGDRVSGDQFVSARWDLLPDRRYVWASVQTVRGCPNHWSKRSPPSTARQSKANRSSAEDGVNPRGECRRGTGGETDGGAPVTTRDVARRVADVVGHCDDRDGAEALARGDAVGRRAARLSGREFDDDDIGPAAVTQVYCHLRQDIEAQRRQLVSKPRANVVILQREQNDGSHGGAAG